MKDFGLLKIVENSIIPPVPGSNGKKGWLERAFLPLTPYQP